MKYIYFNTLHNIKLYHFCFSFFFSWLTANSFSGPDPPVSHPCTRTWVFAWLERRSNTVWHLKCTEGKEGRDTERAVLWPNHYKLKTDAFSGLLRLGCLKCQKVSVTCSVLEASFDVLDPTESMQIPLLSMQWHSSLERDRASRRQQILTQERSLASCLANWLKRKSWKSRSLNLADQ